MRKRWFALSRGQATLPGRRLRGWGVIVAAAILASGAALVLLWFHANATMTVPSPLQYRQLGPQPTLREPAMRGSRPRPSGQG